MRTFAAVAIVSLLGWIAIQIVFGVAGGIVGLLLSIAWLALKVLLAVGIVYWVVSVFSPETARKMKDAVKGETL